MQQDQQLSAILDLFKKSFDNFNEEARTFYNNPKIKDSYNNLIMEERIEKDIIYDEYEDDVKMDDAIDF
jgi:hypothetical protein